MSYYRDLGEYLKALQNHGLLVRIKREVNKDPELHPLVRLQFRGLAGSMQFSLGISWGYWR